MKSVLTVLAVSMSLAMAFASLVGCSNVADNSLLTNDKGDSSSHVVDKTPLSTEVYIAADSPNLAMATAAAGTTSQVEVTGNCYVSTYAAHYINAYIGSSTSPMGIMDLKNPAAAPLCRDGRFTFIISASSVPVGTTEVRITLSVVDPKEGVILNQANAVKYINVTRPN